MKFVQNAFRSDVVYFTWKDLWKLMLGMEISSGALSAKRGKHE
jgi:hypothetical protein